MAHPGGRPTKYTPEIGEKVISLMYEGDSIYEVAHKIKVHKDTIYEWAKVHPEFSDSLKCGRDFSQGWWMIQGKENIHHKEFNSALWFMNMKNRFGWSDKQENTHNVSVKQEEAVKDLA